MGIDLHELIYMIPDLINLFLPGFIFMFLYNWIIRTEMESYIIGLWSLFLSCFIKVLCSAIHSFVMTNIDFNESLKIIIYVVVAVILSFFTVRIQNSKYVEQFLDKTTNKTVNIDILDDVVDVHKRNMMIVYLKDSEYYFIGALRLHEEKGKDSYIVLIEYALYDKNNDELICDYSETNSTVVINLQDIEYFQILYEDDSEKWKWLNKYNKNYEQS